MICDKSRKCRGWFDVEGSSGESSIVTGAAIKLKNDWREQDRLAGFLVFWLARGV
jgi:hypothetical protein